MNDRHILFSCPSLPSLFYTTLYNENEVRVTSSLSWCSCVMHQIWLFLALSVVLNNYSHIQPTFHGVLSVDLNHWVYSCTGSGRYLFRQLHLVICLNTQNWSSLATSSTKFIVWPCNATKDKLFHSWFRREYADLLKNEIVHGRQKRH